MFEEFGVDRGAARIDLALIANELEAYELKSDLDDFSRMHNQIHAYNRVFDRLWIVVGSTHVRAVLTIVPRWWGILVGKRNSGMHVELEELRAAEENPSQDRTSVASLLWRDEAIQLLHAYGLNASKRANRAQLSQLLAQALDMATLRECVTRSLLQRTTTISSIS